MSDSDSKRLKPDQDFPTIGEQAENVEYVNSSDLRNTGAEDSQGRPVQEVDSLCMRCHETGTSRLLFTTIPNFREVIVISFSCPHCGFKNTEVQTAQEMQPKGSKITVELTTKEDLDRQVIKTDFATCQFPELDVEIPAANGRVTSVEGLLRAMRDDLASDQDHRKEVDLPVYEQIQAVIEKLDAVFAGSKFPFTFVLDDPSGNSFVGYDPSEYGNKWKKQEYTRTPAQNRLLGLNGNDSEQRNESVAANINSEIDQDVPEDMREEVQTIPGQCPNCHQECPTRMKMVNIPHFKDVIIMSTACDHCDYKNNEVKTGGAIPDKGKRIKLVCEEPEDLSRDLLKSETCHMRFPELDLDLQPGTLGGRFTTVEGLMREVYTELESKVFNSQLDSMEASTKERWANFLARLQTAIDGQLLPFTIEMEDPLAASYIQNVYAPDPDPNMTVTEYERTKEQNDDLGLTDMDAN